MGVTIMDPNECYAEMVFAINREDNVEARDHALNLAVWLSKGGFAPSGVPIDEVRANLRMVMEPYADRPVPQGSIGVKGGTQGKGNRDVSGNVLG